MGLKCDFPDIRELTGKFAVLNTKTVRFTLLRQAQQDVDCR
tara:strand:- start:439 stop:561 length:123 start_codon:yes stop_codon:yes gene_type:complete